MTEPEDVDDVEHLDEGQRPASPGDYQVVVNDEEQYSIWASGRDLPLGWRAVGPTGSKDDCLAHIRTVWTDMRPKSLRARMS